MLRAVVLSLRASTELGRLTLIGSGLNPAEALDYRERQVLAAALADQIERGEFKQALLAKVRGYVMDSVGVPHQNDIGEWDDASFAWSDASDHSTCLRVRSNADPTRQGTYSDGRGVATVVAPQLYFVREGPHRDRRGLRQNSPILIDRHGADHVRGKGLEFRQAAGDWPYTNEHEDKGAGTGSAGCGTYPGGEWDRLYGLLRGVGRVPVVMIDESDVRAWKAAGLL